MLKARGDDASAETLRWHLIKSNFREEAADKLIKTYLASRELVTRARGAYDFQEELREDEERTDIMADDPAMKARFFGQQKVAAQPPAATPERRAPESEEGLGMGVHERILQSGMLSKTASYRVIVSGKVGEAELNRLLRKIEMDKEILADDFSDPETDGVDVESLL